MICFGSASHSVQSDFLWPPRGEGSSFASEKGLDCPSAIGAQNNWFWPSHRFTACDVNNLAKAKSRNLCCNGNMASKDAQQAYRCVPRWWLGTQPVSPRLLLFNI